ncbi:MAG TPA: T9SS type A sorting domain-containing protein [Bacteroidia bacterium]|nr:T9SS type A sorting domain-containing protein [Bacteroidia bacterium]
MKKILLLGGLMLGAALTSTAQITINRSDWGNIAGTSFIQANDTLNLNLLSPGNAGTNQSWNLAGTGNDYADTMQFVNPTGTLCSNSFPTATLAAGMQGQSVYLYDDNTVIEVLGFCGILFPPDTLVSQFTPPQKQVTFPSTFNTSFSGLTRQVLQFANSAPPPDSIRVVSTTNYTSLIDGWGNVTTPAGTYPALRQKHTRYQLDSTYVYMLGSWQFFGSPSLDTTIEYSWLSQNNPFVATIETDGSGNIISAKYLLSTIVGVDETHDISPASSVFPNPATTELRIQDSGFRIDAVEIYDVLGEKVFSQAPGTKHYAPITIDVSGLKPGIYFVTVRDEKNNLVVKKIVKM